MDKTIKYVNSVVSSSPKFFIKKEGFLIKWSIIFSSIRLKNLILNLNLQIKKIFTPTSRWAKEEIRHSTQKIKELSDESIIFSATVSGLIEVKKGILGMGSSAQVLSPQILRKEIEEEIEGMERRYK